MEDIKYERDAMAGKPMPNGLEYPDQILYMELTLLYERYKKGLVDREVAKCEKMELLKTYEAIKIVYDYEKEWVKMKKVTELARAECRKNPSYENTMRLIDAIEGKCAINGC